MSLGGATGLIGTAIGLGVLVGVAGLAFQAIERTFPDGQRRGKQRRRQNIFGVNEPPRRKSSGRGMDNIFDLGLTQRQPRRKQKFRSNVGSDFNIFAV